MGPVVSLIGENHAPSQKNETGGGGVVVRALRSFGALCGHTRGVRSRPVDLTWLGSQYHSTYTSNIVNGHLNQTPLLPEEKSNLSGVLGVAARRCTNTPRYTTTKRVDVPCAMCQRIFNADGVQRML